MKHGFAAAVIATAVVLWSVAGSPARAASIIDEWKSVKMPPPPALKPVTADPKTTTLVLSGDGVGNEAAFGPSAGQRRDCYLQRRRKI